LPVLDPLKIDRLDLIRDEKSPVNIKLNFRDIELTGISKAKVYKLSGFNRNSQSDKVDFRFKMPQLQITGPYKSFGKILLLPIQGDGTSNMTLGEPFILLV
jgi:Haemolymph juvenile hormone binding protein (JHBP)